MKKIVSALLLIFSCEAKNYKPYTQQNKLIVDKYGFGCYLDSIFIDKIDPNEIDTIVEIGSRDCVDAIRLANFYKTKVIAFECNPEAVAICKKNIFGNPNIELLVLQLVLNLRTMVLVKIVIQESIKKKLPWLQSEWMNGLMKEIWKILISYVWILREQH
jgi:hypothetical protein